MHVLMRFTSTIVKRNETSSLDQSLDCLHYISIFISRYQRYFTDQKNDPSEFHISVFQNYHLQTLTITGDYLAQSFH